MAELGIPHVRLVMPTRENCAQLESLLDATSALVETKKVVDRVDQEIRILKARLGRKASEGSADAEADPDADGDADADGETNTGTGTGAATPMNVDDGEGDPGRAQSVVSTRSGRSGRSRKQVRATLVSTEYMFDLRVACRPDARCQSRQLKPQPPFPREVEGRNRSARNDVYITIVHMCNALSH